MSGQKKDNTEYIECMVSEPLPLSPGTAGSLGITREEHGGYVRIDVTRNETVAWIELNAEQARRLALALIPE